jgi:hypothetical protein
LKASSCIQNTTHKKAKEETMGKGARRARTKTRKEAREKSPHKNEERKPHYFVLELPESVETAVAKGIDDALQKWQLELDKDTTGKVAQTGNREFSPT